MSLRQLAIGFSTPPTFSSALRHTNNGATPRAPPRLAGHLRVGVSIIRFASSALFRSTSAVKRQIRQASDAAQLRSCSLLSDKFLY